jgi:hypothetical protein
MSMPPLEQDGMFALEQEDDHAKEESGLGGGGSICPRTGTI